jgi:Asp-tRNA(Asn)/Glu-tRNA(Gln) amidotransferase A subunit family amidase
MTYNKISRREFTHKSAIGAMGLAIGSSFFSQARAAQDGLAMSWSEWGKLDATAIGFPAISLPTGLLKSGLPCGSQLQGRWGVDGRIMQVAAQIERAKPDWFNMVAPVHSSLL